MCVCDCDNRPCLFHFPCDSQADIHAGVLNRPPSSLHQQLLPVVSFLPAAPPAASFCLKGCWLGQNTEYSIVVGNKFVFRQDSRNSSYVNNYIQHFLSLALQLFLRPFMLPPSPVLPDTASSSPLSLSLFSSLSLSHSLIFTPTNPNLHFLTFYIYLPVLTRIHFF